MQNTYRWLICKNLTDKPQAGSEPLVMSFWKPRRRLASKSRVRKFLLTSKSRVPKILREHVTVTTMKKTSRRTQSNESVVPVKTLFSLFHEIVFQRELKLLYLSLWSILPLQFCTIILLVRRNLLISMSPKIVQLTKGITVARCHGAKKRRTTLA